MRAMIRDSTVILFIHIFNSEIVLAFLFSIFIDLNIYAWFSFNIKVRAKWKLILAPSHRKLSKTVILYMTLYYLIGSLLY